MIKVFSFLMFGFLLLLAVPLCLGIAGGLFGMIFGAIGAFIGLFFGLVGFVFEGIAWIFSSIMDLLFGWDFDFGCHPHWHFNGFIFAALVVLIIVFAQKKKGN